MATLPQKAYLASEGKVCRRANKARKWSVWPLSGRKPFILIPSRQKFHLGGLSSPFQGKLGKLTPKMETAKLGGSSPHLAVRAAERALNGPFRFAPPICLLTSDKWPFRALSLPLRPNGSHFPPVWSVSAFWGSICLVCPETGSKDPQNGIFAGKVSK